MSLTKKRWIVLFASCIINLCIGSLYAWSVFSSPMAAHLSLLSTNKTADLSIIFTVANAVGPITMISGGFINDRLGPKWAIFFGGLLFGFGMIASGFAVSTEMLLVTYGLGVGLGVGLVYGCTVSNSVKLFPDKRGFAGGITTASYGISSVIIPPIANLLISELGITAAFKIFGVTMLIIICTAAFYIVPCPKNFLPDGWNPPVGTRSAFAEKNWQAMLKDPVFYIMLIILCCGAFSGLMIVSQASPLAQRAVGMNTAAAATVVSVLALFNTCGRIIAGFVYDKIGAVKTIRNIFIISLAGLCALYFCNKNIFIFYFGICLVGLAFGSVMGTYPGFTASQFGTKNNSVNYGIMFCGFAVAGYFGPSIMSRLYLKNSSYSIVFIIAAALSASGFLLTFLFQKIQHCQKTCF